jgi:hypothetical protein
MIAHISLCNKNALVLQKPAMETLLENFSFGDASQ